jgi:hypothetical protein
MMTQKRLKPKEVAELWQCSVGQVLSLLRSGKLKGINISSASRPRYVIDPEEVQRFENKGAERPTLRRPKKIDIPKHLRV